MDTTNENTECCQLLKASPEGEQLASIADALSVLSGTEGFRSRLIRISHKVDYLANDSVQMGIWKERAQCLEKELKELRSVEDSEKAKLGALVDRMRRNGSGMNHSTNFRQLLHDFLNHMTITDQEGKPQYDDTNKLVHKK